MQTRNYTVAGHTFRLQMETNSPLWESLKAYTPFETTGTSDGAEPIFNLHIATGLTTEDSTAEAEEGLTLIFITHHSQIAEQCEHTIRLEK